MGAVRPTVVEQPLSLASGESQVWDWKESSMVKVLSAEL